MRLPFALVTIGLLAGTVGCGDLEEAMNAERKPVTPPGMLPVDQMGGNVDEIAKSDGNAEAAANGNGEANVQPTPPAEAAPPDESSIPKVDARMVDMKAEMAKNPNLVVIDNKIQGSDPLSVTASAYVTLRTKPGLLAFQHNLKIWKATNDNRNPSFEEFQQMAAKLRFGPLKPYQVYGYDVDKGGLVILEDKAEKKKHFEAKGIPFEE